MKIGVGTSNPVKINAVQAVVERVWPGAEVVSVPVPSGVSDQPMTDKETLSGAINRAQGVLDQSDVDMGVGLEGGVEDSEHGMFLMGWVAIISREGKKGLGKAGMVLMPEHVASGVRDGKELGPLMDEITGDKDTKKKYGTIGLLTNKMIPRQTSFEFAVIKALAPFMLPEMYDRL